jgi:hypothetical protein
LTLEFALDSNNLNLGGGRNGSHSSSIGIHGNMEKIPKSCCTNSSTTSIIPYNHNQPLAQIQYLPSGRLDLLVSLVILLRSSAV